MGKILYQVLQDKRKRVLKTLKSNEYRMADYCAILVNFGHLTEDDFYNVRILQEIILQEPKWYGSCTHKAMVLWCNFVKKHSTNHWKWRVNKQALNQILYNQNLHRDIELDMTWIDTLEYDCQEVIDMCKSKKYWYVLVKVYRYLSISLTWYELGTFIIKGCPDNIVEMIEICPLTPHQIIRLLALFPHYRKMLNCFRDSGQLAHAITSGFTHDTPDSLGVKVLLMSTGDLPMDWDTFQKGNGPKRFPNVAFRFMPKKDLIAYQPKTCEQIDKLAYQLRQRFPKLINESLPAILYEWISRLPRAKNYWTGKIGIFYRGNALDNVNLGSFTKKIASLCEYYYHSNDVNPFSTEIKYHMVEKSNQLLLDKNVVRLILQQKDPDKLDLLFHYYQKKQDELVPLLKTQLGIQQ